VISANDNVATALEPLEPGSTIKIGDLTIAVTDRIPLGHKVAIRAISTGDAVVKYGSPIGTASAAIAAGAHVHTHNVTSARGRGDLAAIAAGPGDSPACGPTQGPTQGRTQGQTQGRTQGRARGQTPGQAVARLPSEPDPDA
jgi:altronate dehydratase